jgi:hypothetical protein
LQQFVIILERFRAANGLNLTAALLDEYDDQGPLPDGLHRSPGE